MTNKEFNTMLDRRIDLTKKVLSSKANEYAQADDRLRDFHLIAKVANVDIGTVWKVLHAKHLVSVYNMMDGKLDISQDMIDEKIGDKINYGPLAEAILLEKLEVQNFVQNIKNSSEN